MFIKDLNFFVVVGEDFLHGDQLNIQYSELQAFGHLISLAESLEFHILNAWPVTVKKLYIYFFKEFDCVIDYLSIFKTFELFVK